MNEWRWLRRSDGKNAAGVKGWIERLTVDACLPTSCSNKAGPRSGLRIMTPEADNRDTTFHL